MGMGIDEEAESTLSDDHERETAGERRDRPLSRSQLGDFTKVYAFLLGTPKDKDTSCNQDNLHAADTLDALPSTAVGYTPTRVSRSTETEPCQKVQPQPVTAQTCALASQPGPDIASRPTIVVRAAGGEVPEDPETPSWLPQRPGRKARHVAGFLSNGAVLQRDAAKHQRLGAKIQQEIRMDVVLWLKHFSERPVTHIFIDMSNIFIGFNDTLKSVLGIPDRTRVPRVPLDFAALTKILERGRKIGAREVVGSAADPENVADLPQYFHDAESMAYNTSILRRVLKPSKQSSRDASSPSTATSSGASSSESGEYYGISHRDMSYREQGVDEILQLKMGNTAMAYLGKPGVIVLATGDAEKAEYSDGFKKQVGRILKMGWVVEVVSWNRGLSSAWKRPGWTQKWGDRFRIIALDPFIDELLVT